MPRDRSQPANAPATTVSTTSLTVPPSASLTVLVVRQLLAGDGEPPVRADRDVQRRFGRRVQPRPDELSDAFGGVAQDVQRPRRAGDGGDAARGHRCGRPHHPAGAGEQQLGLGGLRFRHPSLEGLSRGCRRALEIEDDGRQVDAGDPVDDRVMGLGDDREAVPLESLHEPVLPQRLGSIQPLGRDPRGEQQQLLLASRLGQRGVADVVLEVEVRIVDPQRPPGLQRRCGELLAVARDEVQPAADVVGELVEVGRRSFEDQHPADVHVRRVVPPDAGTTHRWRSDDRDAPARLLPLATTVPELRAYLRALHRVVCAGRWRGTSAQNPSSKHSSSGCARLFASRCGRWRRCGTSSGGRDCAGPPRRCRSRSSSSSCGPRIWTRSSAVRATGRSSSG